MRSKNDKKGFTLIELLAVIVLLAIILIIAIPAIGNIIDGVRDSAYKDDEGMMEKAAKTYVVKNPTILPKTTEETERIDLTTLVSGNYINEIKDPKDNSTICTGYVDVEKVSNRKYNYNAFLSCGDNYTTDGMSGQIETVIDSNPGALSGSGTEQDPYLVESTEDLVAFGQAVDGGNSYMGEYIELSFNLDFNIDSSYVDPNTTSLGDINGDGSTEGIKSELTTSYGFNSIGNTSNPFLGNFNGDSKYIKNLYMNQDIEANGLFTYIAFGSVSNLGLTNVNVVGGQNTEYIGSLSALVYESNISNCYMSGSVSTQMPINQYMGGLIGGADNSIITNSYTTGTVDGITMVGGIVGFADDSQILNSYSTGDISGYLVVGGIVGNNFNSTVTSCYTLGDIDGSTTVGGIVGDQNGGATIENSYMGGNVTGTGGDIGGIVGESWGTISNCYNKGNVSGEYRVAGIAGQLNSGSLHSSYSIGTINAESSSGGLVGGLYNGGTIENSYNKGNVTGTETNIGGAVGYLDTPGGASISNVYRYDSLTCTSCDNTYGTAVTATNLGLISWHTNTLGWTSQWQLTANKYPLLYKKDTTTLLGAQTSISTP